MERASDSSSSVDPLSVEYIENAIAIYSAQSSRILSVEGMPEDVRQDFAFVDADLMKESLSRYRMFIREVSVN